MAGTVGRVPAASVNECDCPLSHFAHKNPLPYVTVLL